MKLFCHRAVFFVVASFGFLFLHEYSEGYPSANAPQVLTPKFNHQELRLSRERFTALAHIVGAADGSPFRRWWKPAASLALVSVALVWWLTLRPTNDRDWSPEYTEIPWAEINGDEVTIHNFRNCDYVTATDFTARWETKTVHLSKLCGLDLFMNYWGSRHIAHTLLSFDFGDEGHVCTSIETRRERHEPYSAVRGFIRQYELCYVIGDESDLIRLRTNFRDQNVYLYRLAQASPEKYRALFLTYLQSANDLRDHPRWYHATLNNCTTNIRLNAHASGFPSAWNWRMLINGYFDELLYQRGLIASSLDFTKTKARAQINQRARRAKDALDFSERIRTPAA